jgi:hypothetical protein
MEVFEKPADPRTVGSNFERDPCGGIFLREPAEGLTVIGDGAFVDNFAARIERADGMLGVAEIETDGGGWNEVVHGSADSSTALKRRPLPSHLILFGFLCYLARIVISDLPTASKMAPQLTHYFKHKNWKAANASKNPTCENERCHYAI